MFALKISLKRHKSYTGTKTLVALKNANEITR